MMKNKVKLITMADQLKSDLKKTTETSYSSRGEIRLRVNGENVLWEMGKGKHLMRYADGNVDVSIERVTSFKYQFVFSKYFAYEIFSMGNFLMHGMIETKG